MNDSTGQLEIIDAWQPAPDRDIFDALTSKSVDAVCIRNLISTGLCQHLQSQFIRSAKLRSHDDVNGLRIIGPSHFQASRDAELATGYHADSRANISWLRLSSAPYGSPFDVAMGFLSQNWTSGAGLTRLETEGDLAPFTIRLFEAGVGIEPHQDVLAAESPTDSTAAAIRHQFGANIYIAMPTSGGELTIYDSIHENSGPKDLSSGPYTVPTAELPDPKVAVKPAVGDLIIFQSRKIHAVSPHYTSDTRITLSFFIGMTDSSENLKIWA